MALQGGGWIGETYQLGIRLRRASAQLPRRELFNIGLRLHAAKRHSRNVCALLDILKPAPLLNVIELTSQMLVGKICNYGD